MLRGIYGDPERFKEQYWSQIPGSYFTGDGARQDEDGYIWVMGRVDDVINVSGIGSARWKWNPHWSRIRKSPKPRLWPAGRNQGTGHHGVSSLFSWATRRRMRLKEELRTWVGKEIGSLAKPDDIRFTDPLPKTRSGKIMRRLLRELAAGGEVKGDVTTLEDLGVLAKLRADEE